jgi:DNA polymerase I
MNLNVTDQNYHAIVRKLVLDQRKASKGTNLQNIPSRGNGDLVRKCFLPPEGHLLIGADLSAIEPRLMSHRLYVEYGDNSMRQAYIDGVDLYQMMASKAFGIPEEYCSDGAWWDPTTKTGGLKKDENTPKTAFFPRKRMKQGLLAKAYRQSVKSASRTLEVDMQTAEEFFQRFDDSFPNFERMVVDTIEGMKRTGYVETIYGRKRRWPDYKRMKALADKQEQQLLKLYRERKKLMDEWDRNAKNKARFKKIQQQIEELSAPRALVAAWERQAFNATIQGSGADMLKMIGIEMARVCRERGWKLMASIHDEIIIAVPVEEVTPETIKIVERVMTQTATISLPLKTDIVISPRWMEDMTPEEYFAKTAQ